METKKLGSQPFNLIQGVTWRTRSTGWGRPKVSQAQTLCPRSQLGEEGKKTLNLMGRQCLCCDEIGVKCWWAEKMGLLISLGKENKSFRDLAALQQGLEGLGTSLHSETGKEFQGKKNATQKGTSRHKRTQPASNSTSITWQPGAMTHLQPSGTCFRSISSLLGPSSPFTFLSHTLLGLWDLRKI